MASKFMGSPTIAFPYTVVDTIRFSFTTRQIIEMACTAEPPDALISYDDQVVGCRVSTSEEERSNRRLKAMTPSNATLLKLAAKYPPPPKFFEGEMKRPW